MVFLRAFLILMLCLQVCLAEPLQEANTLIQSGQLKKAEILLTESLKKAEHKGDPKLWTTLGDLQRALGKTELSATSLRRALSLTSEREKRELLELSIGLTYIRGNQFALAREVLTPLSQRKPLSTNAIRAFEYIAETYRKEELPLKALENHKIAETHWREKNLPTRLARNLYLQASIQLDSSQYEKAAALASESAKHQATADAHLLTAQALHFSLKVPQSTPHYRAALKLGKKTKQNNPRFLSVTRALLAQVLELQGEKAEALELYESVDARFYPGKPYFLAELYGDLGLNEKALAQTEIVELQAKKIPWAVPDSRLLRIRLLTHSGRYQEAERTLALFQTPPKDLEKDFFLAGAKLYRLQDRYPLCQEFLDKCKLVVKKSDDPSLLMEQGMLFQAEARFAEAATAFRQAGESARKSYGAKSGFVSESLLALSGMEAVLGQVESAKSHLAEAIEHRRQNLGGKHLLTSHTLAQGAQVYRILGEVQWAEDCLRESHAIRAEVTGPKSALSLTTQTELASLLQDLGKAESSEILREVEASLPLLEPEERGPIISVLNLTLASSVSDPQLQLEYLLSGLPHTRQFTKTTYLLKLAELYEDLGDHKKAQDALLSLRESGNLLVEALIYSNKGQSTFANGDLDAASAHFQKSLSLLAHLPISPFSVKPHLDLARVRRLQAQPQKAWQEIQKAIAIEDKLIEMPGGNEASRLLYAEAVETLIALERPGKALEVADNSLARNLKRVLAKSTAGGLAGIPHALTDELDSLNRQLAEVVSAFRQTNPLQRNLRQESESLVKKQENLDRLKEELLSKIRSQYPQYSQLLSPQPLSLPELQESLTDDQAVLVYLLGRDKSRVFLVTNSALEQQELPAGKLIDQAALSFQKALKSSLRSRAVLVGKQKDTSARKLERQRSDLGKLLVEPLVAWKPLLKDRSLIIVPTGNLWAVPFECLPKLDGTGYLVSDHSISYTPSLSLYLRLKAYRATERDRISKPTLIGAADYDQRANQLPFAEQELNELAKLLPNPRLFTGVKATQSAYLSHQTSEQASLIHFATHGVLGAQPALLLTSTESDDGRLELKEIIAQPIQARMVTLSACSSGLGRLRPGEGVDGLARAFLHAGASTVVVSLWNVDDQSTAKLMQAFYRNLASNQPAAALRKAQLGLLEEGLGVEHWAPFVLVGLP